MTETQTLATVTAQANVLAIPVGGTRTFVLTKILQNHIDNGLLRLDATWDAPLVEPARPSDDDTVPVWEEYATALGVAFPSGTVKADLIAGADLIAARRREALYGG